MTLKDKIKTLLNETLLCTISTISPEGMPQAAVVGFSEDSDGSIVIGTPDDSRKIRNILKNPYVALVIGWDANITVQYEGLAHIAAGTERDRYQAIHITKHPKNIKFVDYPNQSYIVVVPTWIRYTDASVQPRQIEETRDFTS